MNLCAVYIVIFECCYNDIRIIEFMLLGILNHLSCSNVTVSYEFGK